MIKRSWVVGLLLCLIACVAIGLVVAISGCEEKTTTTQAPQTTSPASTTATTAPATTATSAPAGEVVKLKYTSQQPPTGWDAKKASGPWLDQIETDLAGRVKIERFWGESLAKGKDTWEALKAGIADFGFCMMQYWANLTPLADVITLPFMPITSAELGSYVIWKLYDEFPSIRKQFADNYPLVIWTSSPFYLLTTKKQVKTPEDIKGLKIRALGGPPTDLLKSLGGVPVSMPMPDTYQALQTGVLDGIFDNWEGFYSFRHYEVGKYYLMVPFHAGYFAQVFNNNSWQKLPQDVKAVFEKYSYENGSRYFGRTMFDSAQAEVNNILKEKGYKIEMLQPTEQEIETVWREKYGKPMWEEWVKKMEAQGFSDARAILNRALELLEQGLPK